MRRALVTAVALLLFTLPAFALPWTTVATQVSKSISYLNGPQGKCTAFTIDAAKDYVLTAGHCEQLSAGVSVMRVGGLPSTVVFQDEKKDLLVLRVEGDEHPALKLAAENPSIGEHVASYGYGYALGRPLFRTAYVSDDLFDASEYQVGPGPYIAVDNSFIGGQSGGPVVNANGEVVAIVQMGAEGLGFGVGAKTIKDKVGKYFSKDTN